MGITSLDIINNLSTNRAKIINILDFNFEKLSIIKTNKNKIHVYYDHNPLRLFLTSVTFCWIDFTAFCLLLISWLSKRF